ncbi:hypothetical protein GCM10009795_026270 [Nocardioides hankookensis]|uniref:Uncharacterized protein n=1 Tax=Nocardioides hankookensis TaxID=443157 RepID=A0ABW1LCE8_9ACTN
MTDGDERFIKHCGYGLIAALWGHVPGYYNLDYKLPGVPYDIAFDDDDLVLEHQLHALLPSVSAVWGAVMTLIADEGRQKVLEALLKDVRTDGRRWTWYLAVRWPEAARGYGHAHPDGLDVRETGERRFELVISPNSRTNA